MGGEAPSLHCFLSLMSFRDTRVTGTEVKNRLSSGFCGFVAICLLLPRMLFSQEYVEQIINTYQLGIPKDTAYKGFCQLNFNIFVLFSVGYPNQTLAI